MPGTAGARPPRPFDLVWGRLGGTHRPSLRRQTAAGYTLLDCLFGLALMAVIAAATVPPLTTAIDRTRAQGAARFVLSRMALARYQAAHRGAIVALRFVPVGADTMLTTFIDGNRNGVLATDIESGADRPEGAPVQFSAEFPGVSLGPLGPEGLVFSFTPLGTSSSGTLYIAGRDGSRFAVRVLGVTARARLLRYLPASESWVDVE